MLFHGSLDGIERNGTNNENRHKDISDWDFGLRIALEHLLRGAGRGRDVGALQQARYDDNALRASGDNFRKIVQLDAADAKDRDSHLLRELVGSRQTPMGG